MFKGEQGEKLVNMV